MFASEVEGTVDDGILGPFETAQGQFYQGRVIPLCVGWFGEISKDFKKIYMLGRHAAVGDDRLSTPLLVNTERKREAF